jgi:hypothetical protein
LHSHVGAKLRSITYVGGLSPRTVGTANVVMVATENDGVFEEALANGIIKPDCQFDTALESKSESESERERACGEKQGCHLETP